MATVDQIRAYIERTFGKSVGPDDSLLDSGLIDSTGIFELVAFLEDTFGVKVEDEEIVPEHFETAAQIAGFVERKKKSGTAA
jgi:acyl carrier protein